MSMNGSVHSPFHYLLFSMITTTEVNDPQSLQQVVVAVIPIPIQTKKLDGHNVVIKVNEVSISK